MSHGLPWTVAAEFDLFPIVYLTDEGMALNYARTKKFAEFSKDELSYLAAKAKLRGKLILDTALETVQRFHAVWRARKS